MLVDFWEESVRGALESGEPINFLISGTLWAIFVVLVFIFKYEVHPAVSLPLAPVVVVGSAFLLIAGPIALLQALVAIVVPALVLFYYYFDIIRGGFRPISVTYYTRIHHKQKRQK